MNSRVIILLVAAAIFLAVLVPAIVFIATILLFVTPALLIAHCLTCEVPNAQPLALRTLPLFRAPPAHRD
jgi:energy-coupling factor transporter transmembrane protein EcfT